MKNERLMYLCYQEALKSPDRRTKLGSIITDIENRIKSKGYNDFPDGFPNDEYSHINKQYFIEHAERKAIYNTCKKNIDLYNCKIFIPAFPCSDCARAIINVGIKKVIVHQQWLDIDNKDYTYAEYLFNKCDVEIVKLNFNLISTVFINGTVLQNM